MSASGPDTAIHCRGVECTIHRLRAQAIIVIAQPYVGPFALPSAYAFGWSKLAERVGFE